MQKNKKLKKKINILYIYPIHQFSGSLKSLQEYLKKEKSINQEIDTMNPNKRSEVNPVKRTEGSRLNNNLDKILEDSDIVVLQKNYDYLFWTILAAGSVVVAMNIKTTP